MKPETYYCVHLIYSNGQNSYLQVGKRCKWKTKRIAQGHANDVNNTKHIFNGLIIARVEEA